MSCSRHRTQSGRATLLGPLITASCLSAYLSCWGFRSLFLLRRVALLSVLCWAPLRRPPSRPVTERSIEQFSDLVYQRLAAMPWLDTSDHPWRLFSAMSLRGADALIATMVIGFSATRRRVSVGLITQLAATAALAIVIHHALVLAAPIDQYEPNLFVRLVTAPWTGTAIAAASIAAVSLVRRWQPHARSPVAEPSGHATSVAADRDPVIFGVGTRHEGGGLVGLLQRCAIGAPCILIILVILAVRTSG